ncbi:hypothetical protein ACFW9N_37180 [Streptomyces sp. NPDC059496]|uniref:hypothetical protein n=1 Tax=Streptomyces sp. NPDC059496 TaxID=3346851 RepID=UPI003686BFDB
MIQARSWRPVPDDRFFDDTPLSQHFSVPKSILCRFHHYIGDIVREAHERWEIPAKATLRTLRQALSLDGELSQEARETYFALLMPREQHAD